MLHGPCGDWCLIDGICSKRFLKDFRNETTMDDNGYSSYRRRDEGITISRNNSVFDNQVVCSVTAVKYLFKYVYKGHDKAGVTISGNIPSGLDPQEQTTLETISNPNNNVINPDEVKNFVDARYVGPVEAAWRIFSKKLQDKSHSIVRLPVHLPNQQKTLWNEVKEAKSEDFNRQVGVERGQKKAYAYINNMIEREGCSFSSFPGMPPVENDLCDNESVQILTQDLSQSYYNKLNINQKEIVDFVLNPVENNAINLPNCIYIDRPGGSGKTFVYTTLCHLLTNKNKIVCTMAYTGIAATLLPNGKTVHRTFGLPVPMFSDSSSHIKPNSQQGKYLRTVGVFIWDEAPMSPRYSLEIIDRTLRHINNNNLPFGGMLIILGGDFRQLLPVQLHATRTERIDLSIKFSPLWKNFHKFSLTQNMRALPEEIEFVWFLLNLGSGTLNNLDDIMDLPDECFTSNNNDIVENVYGRIIKGKRYNELTTTVILSARNIDVDFINTQVVELLDFSTEHIYIGVDSTENCDNENIDDAILPEYLNTLNPPNFPLYELKLRQYSIVMLIRNMNFSEGLCDGTILIILELGVHVLKCEILTGDKTGEIVFINRVTLYCENVYPFIFKRRQFPITIAFCMTINKAQGQTFDKIGIDLTKDVFNHG
ncbi:ATP-dependent DNA helicase pif1-like [Cotesia glomerata]|uniref:ATP-dependent DNA helicase pif1-like n=1 Tax=Cotesia glomerata TaxID=32391 RepID=UPI001D015C2F|nr:ATP-dependent DNA helicase pif1-like [Cotesia glomerata]